MREMATSEKKRKIDENPPKADESVTGFIHCVSPVKISTNGNRFFNMTIQQKDEYTDGVSFSVAAHQQMIEMSKSK